MGRAFSYDADRRQFSGGIIDGTAWITAPYWETRWNAAGHAYRHLGTDAVIPYRTPLLCPHRATVQDVIVDPDDPRNRVVVGLDMGRVVWLDFAGGGSLAIFHMDEVSVQPGQELEQGALLGYSGWSGNVIPRSIDGSHAHIQCSLGPASGLGSQENTVDPMSFLTLLAARPGAPAAPELTPRQEAEQIRDYAAQGVPSPALVSMLDNLIGRLAA